MDYELDRVILQWLYRFLSKVSDNCMVGNINQIEWQAWHYKCTLYILIIWL